MPLQAHAKTVALSISSEESQAQQGGVALAEHRDEVLAQALNARSSSPGGAIATTSASLRVTQQPRQFTAKVQIDRRRREIHAGVERREWHAISMAHELIQKESDPQMSGLDEELLAESLVRRLYKEGGAIGDHIRFQQAVKATWRQLGIGCSCPATLVACASMSLYRQRMIFVAPGAITGWSEGSLAALMSRSESVSDDFIVWIAGDPSNSGWRAQAI